MYEVEKRIIKFEAWNEESKVMLTWEELQKDWKNKGYYDSVFRSDHWIPRQCIGANDKNNNKIYEFDIVKTSWGRIYIVKFRIGGFEGGYETPGFFLENARGEYEEDYHLEWNELEKIGNVFQNPELLNK